MVKFAILLIVVPIKFSRQSGLPKDGSVVGPWWVGNVNQFVSLKYSPDRFCGNFNTATATDALKAQKYRINKHEAKMMRDNKMKITLTCTLTCGREKSFSPTARRNVTSRKYSLPMSLPLDLSSCLSTMRFSAFRTDDSTYGLPWSSL